MFESIPLLISVSLQIGQPQGIAPSKSNNYILVG